MKTTFSRRLIYPLAGILLVIVLGMGIFVYLNRVAMNPITIKEIRVDAGAALKLDGLKQISKKNGITEWALSAASATLLKKEDKAVLKQIHITFYTREQKKVLLTSDQGILNTATYDMEFSGNVIIRHQTYTLKTEKLHYEKKAHIIYANSHITLEDRNSVIEADAMTVELNKNRTVLQGHVKGKFSESFDIP